MKTTVKELFREDGTLLSRITIEEEEEKDLIASRNWNNINIPNPFPPSVIPFLYEPCKINYSTNPPIQNLL